MQLVPRSQHTPGSVVVTITDESSGVEARGYDPFGKPHDGDWAEKTPPVVGSAVTDRGFTDHEHLDESQLIHMNGRAYDYHLGRFLSVDPIVQAPGNSQSLNPYSYIMNNPLAGTDPSGYCSKAEVDDDGGVQCAVMVTGSRIMQTFEGTIGGDGSISYSGAGTIGGNILVGNNGLQMLQSHVSLVPVAPSITDTNSQHNSGNEIGPIKPDISIRTPLGSLGVEFDRKFLRVHPVLSATALDFGVLYSILTGKDYNAVGGEPLDGTDKAIAAAQVGLGFATKGPTRGLRFGKNAVPNGIRPGPAPNNGIARPHGGARHNDAIDQRVEALNADPAVTNVRKNQVQVDVNGNRAGNNLPDVQYDRCGVHYCVEYDTIPGNSTRHGDVIRQNGPNAVVELNVL